MFEPRVQEGCSSECSGLEIEDLLVAKKWICTKIMGIAVVKSMVREPSRLWANVQCSGSMFCPPTDAEMNAVSKAFAMHPLITEAIMMQEAWEKAQLGRSYYLYLDPVKIFVVVFRERVISLHFHMTPHHANVRRKIPQLKDYITVSADWISYALIQDLEEVVDDIDMIRFCECFSSPMHRH
ncbi:CorA metal ion transporter [Rhizina undulata]